MNWASLDKWFAAGAVTVLILLVRSEPSNAQSPVFDQLKQKFEEGQIYSAVFSHHYKDSYTGEETYTEGKIWIGKGMYRVESEEQVMVIDGEISRSYDGIRNRLLISSYDEEEDDFAPSKMLQGVDESYVVYEEWLSGHTRVTLETDDPFAVFVSVEILISEEGNPIEIMATDQVDNIHITRFTGGYFSPDDPTLFEIVVPDDAERVDLRH